MTTSPKTQPELIIRGQEADDWEDIAAILLADQVVYYTLQLPYQSRDRIRENTENPPATHLRLAAEIDERVIGLIGLSQGSGRRAHTAELGMMVHPDFQGQGVGTALMKAAINLAENWLNINRIELTVFTDNQPALALYEKYGFEIEGTLRDGAFRDGSYADLYLMARLRGEI
ncbi:MAG: GNAT family N-acetyltransferase [Anaerolineae bacterium]|nr:GNAT family N-acetyltransferase [Anaerolineae bacterium]